MDTFRDNEQQRKAVTGVREIVVWAKEAGLNTDEILLAES